jgi:hypothetical protein
MATTTPNFGWPVPTSTDLVKDGATAIEGLGDAIDASLLDLKGGTTNQVLAKNSNTDMDFKWVADAAGMTNPMTTTGDTIYSSSGSTPARLGIGSTGQVLTVAGGVPSWATPSASASGLTLVKAQTIGSAVSSVTVTDAFSSTYENYLITLNGGSASTNINIRLTLGATTSGYFSVGIYQTLNSATINGILDSNLGFTTCGNGTDEALMAQSILQNPNLAKKTLFQNQSVGISGGRDCLKFDGFLDTTTQYTAFTLTASSGTMTGGTVRVYGYQKS